MLKVHNPGIMRCLESSDVPSRENTSFYVPCACPVRPENLVCRIRAIPRSPEAYTFKLENK